MEVISHVVFTRVQNRSHPMKRLAIPLFVWALALPSIAVAQAPAAKNTAALSAYLDGLDAFAAHKYADAVEAFSKAVDADEENPTYYFARGVARTFNQQFPQAISDLQRAQRLAGNNVSWEV